MGYQQEIAASVDGGVRTLGALAQTFEKYHYLSNNTAVLRGDTFPKDFISLNGVDIDGQWKPYPLRRTFIVDTDYETMFTTDAVVQSYGVLVQFSYDILSAQYMWEPGDDDGLFFDRRYGGASIHSIGRKQLLHFVKLPRGEYTLQAKVKPIPDVVGQGLAGVAEVSIGVRGLR